jgi:hypothetical protein
MVLTRYFVDEFSGRVFFRFKKNKNETNVSPLPGTLVS